MYEWTKSYGTAVQFAGILSFIAAAVQSLAVLLERCSTGSGYDQNIRKSLNVVVEADESLVKESSKTFTHSSDV